MVSEHPEVLVSMQAVLTKDPPEALQDHYTKEHVIKTRAYSIDKKNFGLVKGVFDFAENVALLYFLLFPVAWRLARSSVQAIRPAWADNEYAVSVAFALLTAVFETVKGIPWSLYFTFVIEARHGFNKQTLAIFSSDIVKSVRTHSDMSTEALKNVFQVVEAFVSFCFVVVDELAILFADLHVPSSF
jgi:STE24 endopeptidase